MQSLSDATAKVDDITSDITISGGQQSAVGVLNASGCGNVLLLCEHASNFIPSEYDNLGISQTDSETHIAWDIGALELAKVISVKLDAPLVASNVSRLVYDCNRSSDANDAIVVCADCVIIPTNQALSEAQRQHRVDSVYQPFRRTVEQLLRHRRTQSQVTIIVTIHSFTSVFNNKFRDVEIGLLHDSDSRLADAMLSNAALISPRIVKRNEPYGPTDNVTHSLKIYGIEHNLANVMIEVRNDLLSTTDEITKRAEEILTLLCPAVEQLTSGKQGAHNA
jgi:predicted N-formylglutamate amidohydrolase